MSTNEGQPSGLNPEWEINKDQNIQIAKRLFGLLLDLPTPSFPFMQKLECISMSRQLNSADNKRKIFIEADRELVDNYGPYSIIPQSFRPPLFGLTLRTNDMYDFTNQSTKYGELPTHVIASDRSYCVILNNYAFNLSGQGVKIEFIVPHSLPLESYFGKVGALEARERLRQLDFVPKESDSRVVPLTPDDYQKINNMFEQIDAGLYKFSV